MQNPFSYQKTLIQTFHTSFLITQKPLWIHSNRTQNKRWFCTQKLALNVRFKDFWYTKIDLSQKYIFQYSSYNSIDIVIYIFVIVSFFTPLITNKLLLLFVQKKIREIQKLIPLTNSLHHVILLYILNLSIYLHIYTLYRVFQNQSKQNFRRG